MKIKVCGITEPQNMIAVMQSGADYVGWIFYPTSPRHVMPHIQALSKVPRGATRVVGVFVNALVEEITTAVHMWKLDAIQLHGTESNDLCRELEQVAPVIKAVHITGPADFDQCLHYPDARYLLLESRSPGWGGSGKPFDWRLLAHYRAPQPFILSGGIGPGNLESLATIDHPRWMGVDLNSRFERVPGIKDTGLLTTFTQALKLQTHDK